MILGVMRFIVCPQLWAFAGDVLKVPGWGIRAHPVAAGCPSDAVGHWLVPCLCSCICPLHLSRMILPPQVRWDPSVSSACTGPSLLHVVSCNISPLSTSRMLIMRYLCMFFFWFFSPFRVCSDSWICRFMSFVILGSCQTLFCLCGTPPPKVQMFCLWLLSQVPWVSVHLFSASFLPGFRVGEFCWSVLKESALSFVISALLLSLPSKSYFILFFIIVLFSSTILLCSFYEFYFSAEISYFYTFFYDNS